MKALVTGGAGFIGSEIVRQLLGAGHDVRVLVRGSTDQANLDGLDVEYVTGDIRDSTSVRRALDGVETLFHTAAFFTHWATTKQPFYDINVRGTRVVMDTALRAGVERVVYTSTNNAIGAYGAGGAAPSNEDVLFNYWSTGDHYSISKFYAENEVFRAGARGLPVVVVNPTLVIGERDRKPTSSGQLVIEVATRRMPVYVDGWVNVVDVRDVARGHLLAAETGRVGQRYLLGGDNLSVRDYFGLIADAAGVEPPRFRAPYRVALAMAHIYQLRSRVTKKYPTATVSELKIGALGESYDSSKAARELGWVAGPATDCVRRSVDWFGHNGHLD